MANGDRIQINHICEDRIMWDQLSRKEFTTILAWIVSDFMYFTYENVESIFIWAARIIAIIIGLLALWDRMKLGPRPTDQHIREFTDSLKELKELKDRDAEVRKKENLDD